MNTHLSLLAINREPWGGFTFCEVPHGDSIERYVVIQCRAFAVCVSVARKSDIPFTVGRENLRGGRGGATGVADLNRADLKVAVPNLLVPGVEVCLGSTIWRSDVLRGRSDDIGNLGAHAGRTDAGLIRPLPIKAGCRSRGRNRRAT